MALSKEQEKWLKENPYGFQLRNVPEELSSEEF